MPSKKLVLLVTFLGAHAAVPAAPFGSGLDLNGFDAAVRVQDDLYRAVNGRWLETTSIAPDKSVAYGADLPDIVDQRVHAIVDALDRRTCAAGGVECQVATYYRDYLDTAAIDKAGLAPLKPALAEIDAIASMAQLAAWQGRMQGRINTPLWLWAGFADFKDPGRNRIMLWQGGLGLPERGYYLSHGEARFDSARQAYERYLGTLATLIGAKDPAQMARHALVIEQQLAAVEVSLEESRDPSKMYNVLDAAALDAKAPGFDWRAFLRAAKLPEGEGVMAAQLPTAVAISALYGKIPLAHWKDYFTLRAVDEAAPVLPQAFREASFAFHGAAIDGAAAPRARWQQGIAQLGEVMGDALSRLYVAAYFPPAHKERVRAMVENLLAVFRESIAGQTWMAPRTKMQALEKLSKYSAKIGYPERWRDYGALRLRAGDALGNRQRAKQFDWDAKVAQAGKPIDRAAWQMSPLEVNAFYDPGMNQVNLTAGILQAPLFDAEADDAANYGGIGAQIGHEISHGFDNLGAQFDGDGVMRDWWTADDHRAFEAFSARLVAQYNAYEALPGKHVDGKLSLPENIADLTGLQMAYAAYQRALGGKAAPLIDGYTGEQRFFLSYAQSWRKKQRAERVLQELGGDPHAPNEFRANGAAVNVDAFHAAFGTRPGDAMYKPAEQRVRIW